MGPKRGVPRRNASVSLQRRVVAIAPTRLPIATWHCRRTRRCSPSQPARWQTDAGNSGRRPSALYRTGCCRRTAASQRQFPIMLRSRRFLLGSHSASAAQSSPLREWMPSQCSAIRCDVVEQLIGSSARQRITCSTGPNISSISSRAYRASTIVAQT